MDPRTWFRSLTPYFLYILFIATIGPLLFGYHLAELNTPQEVITCKRKSLFSPNAAVPTLPQCIKMNPTEIGLVSSIFTLGGLIGALTGGPLSSRLGRLRTMQFTTIFFIVGPVFEALAPSIPVMAFGRLISGIGAGASVVVVPIYISEIAPPAEKGFFGSLTQVMVNAGIFVTQLLGYFLSYGQMWRLVLAVGGAIGAAQAVGLLFSAESPTWTADQGKGRKARTVLAKIRGDKFDIEDEVSGWRVDDVNEVNDEEETLLTSDEHMSLHSGNSTGSHEKMKHLGMFEVIRHPEHNKAVLAVVMVMIAQQFTGINSIIMYGVALLADLLQSNAAALNLAVSAINIIVTASCAPLVDNLGRKYCLLVSIGGMGVSSLLLAIGITRSLSVLSAVAVLFFVGSFGVGLGPIPFILSSELVSTDAVGATQSWALGANWISTFIVAQFFPIVNEALGKGKIYFIFAGAALFFGSFVAWWVPETMGKKDADEVWGRSNVRQD
ncbi:putative MFS glucose transporter [Tothia fuscella]|uniref:MFS glucose transporter n=1 Tax=Tothia fuscella TaxID=1048955 RepID=A0A9P4NJQ8_9PEZI|nr:putative MFS glucose transporter [Tothia fuscella]